MKRAFLILLALLAPASCSNRTVHRSMAQLHSVAEVFTDGHGIPHIYGRDLHDALFMQGYITARDRLFQIEWLRMQAAGRISEFFGPDWRSQDLFVRAMGFRRRAEEWAASAKDEDPFVWEAVVSYTAGVNAYIADAAGNRGARLSPLFAALGVDPEPVSAEDILAADRLITYNATPGAALEVEIFFLRNVLLPGAVFDDLFMVAPAEPVAVVPGFFSAGFADGPLIRVEPKGGPRATPAAAREVMKRLEKLQSRAQRLSGGSNAWTVGRAFTRDGIPLLANDTHQGLGNPPVYHQVHVDAGANYHAEGLAFAGGPGVMLGHNGLLAWGATVSMADDSDVWLETKRDGGKAVAFKGHDVPIKFHDEVWTYRNRHDACATGPNPTCAKEGQETITFGEVPHHGPLFPKEVLPAEVADVFMFSMRWTGFDGGFRGSGVRSFFTLGTATTPDEAEAAFLDYTGGGFNIHYATTSGHHGYHGRKSLPVRTCDKPAWLALPGDGSCEWNGTLALDDIPHDRDPARGFIVSANNDTGGQTFGGTPEKGKRYIGAIYDSGFRAKRIEERLVDLTARGGLTRNDIMDLQADNLSLLARRLVPYFAEALARKPSWAAAQPAPLRAAAEAMARWDYRTASTSPVPHLFHAWFARVTYAMFNDEMGGGLLDDLGGLFAQVTVRPLLAYLDAAHPIQDGIDAGTAKFPSKSGHNYFDDSATTDVVETRDSIMLDAFSWAFAEANTAAAIRGFDPDWAKRPWSPWHAVMLENDGGFAYPAMTRGPFPTDGGLFTVDVADFQLLEGGDLRTNFNPDNTPSNRSIFELRKEGSEMWGSIPGGQSEHPGSPFFADWAPWFYANEDPQLRERTYYHVPFQRSDVEAAAQTREVFPAGRP